MRTDGAELLRDAATLDAIERIRAPLRLLRAPRGLLDDEDALIPSAVLDKFAAGHPHADVQVVADVNHYTIVLGDGARWVAAGMEAAIDDALAAA